jgi:hypothetical protein
MRLETLSSCLFISLEGKADKKECNELALHVLDIFGYNDRTTSNQLQRDDISMLYMLEDMELVRQEIEIDKIPDKWGRKVLEWRITSFILCTEKIEKLAISSLHVKNEIELDVETMKDVRKMYEELPEKVFMAGRLQ